MTSSTDLSTRDDRGGLDDRAAEDVPVLRVVDAQVRFPVGGGGLLRRRRSEVVALAGVSLELRRGEILGVVGESGCGKTTLGRTIVGLQRLAGGHVYLGGEEVGRERRTEQRRRVQMVFQDPYGSLNPRRTVRSVLVELLRAHAAALPEGTAGPGRGAARWEARCRELMDMVGLPAAALDRYPEQFSGGQRQRVSIARALTVQPDVLVADEPVSALDVSVQATVLNLITDLRADLGLAVLFISHDIGVVRHVSDRVAVMYLGRVVEEGPTAPMLTAPTHPYTSALVASVPTLPASPTRAAVLPGEPPSPIDPPPGCAFHPRCGRRTDVCAVERPLPAPAGAAGQLVSCHHPVLG